MLVVAIINLLLYLTVDNRSTAGLGSLMHFELDVAMFSSSEESTIVDSTVSWS